MYASRDGLIWTTADRAEMTVFSDCARVTLYWDNGDYAYVIEDDETAARAALRRYGFNA
jgi:hypothetical protein